MAQPRHQAGEITALGGRSPALLWSCWWRRISGQYHALDLDTQCQHLPRSGPSNHDNGSSMTKLHAIAHARAGDKGDSSNVSLWLEDSRHFPALCKAITAERLASEFPDLIKGPIQIYHLPHLSGINIVMHEALEGGVNTSLNLDGHGKSWSFLILGLDIEVDEQD